MSSLSADVLRLTGTISVIENRTGELPTDLVIGQPFTGMLRFDRNAFTDDLDPDPEGVRRTSETSVGAARFELNFGSYQLVGDDRLDNGFNDRTELLQLNAATFDSLILDFSMRMWRVFRTNLAALI